MRKRVILLVFLAALAVGALETAGRMIRKDPASRRVPVAGRKTTAPPPKRNPAGERAGEKIDYNVKLGAIKLGTAVYEQLDAGRLEGREVNVSVFTTSLPRFRDTERIFSDPATNLPLRVERDISMWPKKEKIVERYDQEAYTVELTRNGRRQELLKSGGPLQNAILLPFALRECEHLGPGWEMKVNLPTQKFTVSFSGKETVEVPAGKFETYHLKSEPERFEVWVTSDEKRIPVRIKGSGGIGYTMSMSGYVPPSGSRRDEQGK